MYFSITTMAFLPPISVGDEMVDMVFEKATHLQRYMFGVLTPADHPCQGLIFLHKTEFLFLLDIRTNSYVRSLFIAEYLICSCKVGLCPTRKMYE